MSFLETVSAAWPPGRWCDTTVAVAISGGADSVALLCALQTLKMNCGGPGQLLAAHFNHRLRGSESDADQAFVEGICQQLGVVCVAGTASREERPAQHDESCDEPSLSLADRSGRGASEESARAMRYEFLKQVARNWGARFVATAHTLDDQAETVLHRIVRGTGLGGLSGIRRVRELIPGVTLVRPLLQVRREEIEKFLELRGQPYRHDSSNASPKYTRNRLRHDLLPEIERDFNPRIREALCRLAELAGEVREVIQHRVDDVEQHAVIARDPTELVLDCRQLEHVERYVVRQLLIRLWEQQGWPLQDMSLEKWHSIESMADPESEVPRRASLPGGVRIERVGQRLTLHCLRNN